MNTNGVASSTSDKCPDVHMYRTPDGGASQNHVTADNEAHQLDKNQKVRGRSPVIAKFDLKKGTKFQYHLQEEEH